MFRENKKLIKQKRGGQTLEKQTLNMPKKIYIAQKQQKPFTFFKKNDRLFTVLAGKTAHKNY